MCSRINGTVLSPVFVFYTNVVRGSVCFNGSVRQFQSLPKFGFFQWQRSAVSISPGVQFASRRRSTGYSPLSEPDSVSSGRNSTLSFTEVFSLIVTLGRLQDWYPFLSN